MYKIFVLHIVWYGSIFVSQYDVWKKYPREYYCAVAFRKLGRRLEDNIKIGLAKIVLEFVLDLSVSW